MQNFLHWFSPIAGVIYFITLCMTYRIVFPYFFFCVLMLLLRYHIIHHNFFSLTSHITLLRFYNYIKREKYFLEFPFPLTFDILYIFCAIFLTLFLLSILCYSKKYRVLFYISSRDFLFGFFFFCKWNFLFLQIHSMIIQLMICI